MSALDSGDGWRVGIDTGGTFTDLVAVRGSDLRIAKVPSSPPQFELGVFSAIEAADIRPEDIESLAHGTTVATNAVITGSGAPTALVTTKGFRDVLELRRHNRGDPFDILWDPPDPVIPRRYRYEVRERINYAGDVVEALNAPDVVDAVRAAGRAGIESFAVCFLHSYANSSHEELARALILQESPHAQVSFSAELLREPNEFERTSTTAINACLVPVVAGYLTSLRRTLADRGFAGRLAVMHSGGGLLSVDSAARFPARLVTSGPAAGAMAAQGVTGSGSPAGGVTAAAAVARDAKLDDVISLDIGGTSADIAVIRDGLAGLVNEYAPQFGQVIRFPAIDLVTIGAGGGSLAWIDAGGLPHVGPESAGAVPGPAAYGRGGTAPTVTDANVVAGRLDGSVGLAGGVTLDGEAAARSIGPFAEELGLSVEAAALGIIDIVNSNMARSIRVVTVERGLDPRRFALVPFGGAGPLLAAELAQTLGMTRVVIPIAPGVTSALGCLHVDITHDVGETYIQALETVDEHAVQEGFERLSVAVRTLLGDDGVRPDEQRVDYSIDLRYIGQIKSVTVRLPGAGPRREQLMQLFLEEYERQFHFAARDIGVEIASLRVRGTRPVDHPTIPFRSSGSMQQVSRRVLTREGAVIARVIDRGRLPAGTRLEGPLVLTQLDSTTWVPPGWSAEVDLLGNLRLEYVR